jgi:hypothetical protein
MVEQREGFAGAAIGVGAEKPTFRRRLVEQENIPCREKCYMRILVTG